MGSRLLSINCAFLGEHVWLKQAFVGVLCPEFAGTKRQEEVTFACCLAIK
jgi:hypothetical protein